MTDPQEISIEAKAAALHEALPYIQQFKNAVFVVKFGGAFMEDPEARTRVASDIVWLAAVGIRVVVVHGGGKAISRAMEQNGIEPVFREGLRVTDQKTVEIVAQTLDNELNLELCELIQLKKGSPLGIPGRTVFRCQRLDHDGEGQSIDIGYVGDIRKVNQRVIQSALAKGYTPILSPTASDEFGQVYNTNADAAAAHAAAALGARRLVYLCDVPGLLRDPADPDSLISSLRASEVKRFRAEGIIAGGMAPKVESACLGLAGGVHRVHFIDGRQPHSLLLEIFTDRGVGTEIVNR
jgi:acetylglutamate kinase